MINHSLRYFIDFDVMPTVLHNHPAKTISNILSDPGAKLSTLYNNVWSTYEHSKPFYGQDFTCRHLRRGADEMLFIKLPVTDARSSMACTHIAITYRMANIMPADVRMFHIERGGGGTTAIGEMLVDSDGTQAHLNYGEASESNEENIERIWELAAEPQVEIMLAQ